MANADDHAVLVGINRYPGFQNLQGPELDTSDFEQWLVDEAGGAVPSINIRRATTSLFPAPPPGMPDMPGKDAIDALFQPLVQSALTKGRVGRRLYIFLAGHGFSDSRDMDKTALYTANADPLFTPHVAGTLYAEWFRRNGAFEEIVLVMDCCRSVSELTSVIDPPFPNSGNPNTAREVRMLYAYATEWSLETREKEINGKTRGIFSSTFVDALRHAAPDASGAVTGQRVKDYVHNALSNVTPQPEIRVDTHRDMVLARRAAGTSHKARIQLEPFTAGLDVEIYDGGQKLLTTLNAHTNPVVQDLAQGIYKIVVKGTNRKHFLEIIASDVDVTI